MYKYNEAILAEIMDETCVLYNTETNTTHILNATAKYIWENCITMSVDDIVDSIQSRLKDIVERSVIHEDVTKIVIQFLESNLIQAIE